MRAMLASHHRNLSAVKGVRPYHLLMVIITAAFNAFAFSDGAASTSQRGGACIVGLRFDSLPLAATAARIPEKRRAGLVRGHS